MTNVQGVTAAAEVSVPMLKTTEPDYGAIQTRSYLSLDLSDKDDDEEQSGPPLRLLLERSFGNSANRSALSLSQTVNFDRYQLNPMEDRAPKVRNSLAWTICVERALDNNVANGMDVSMAAVWQLNRSVAVKAVLRPQQVHTALLLKRWAQPRVACSILHRCDWSSGRSPEVSFVGVGVELETGRLFSDRRDELYPGVSNLVGQDRSDGRGNSDVPKTIVASTM